MNYAALTWVTLGAVIVYLATQDENVLPWLVLLSKSFKIWIQRQWFLVRYNPDSPWMRWAIDRNARRIANELIKEQQNK